MIPVRKCDYQYRDKYSKYLSIIRDVSEQPLITGAYFKVGHADMLWAGLHKTSFKGLGLSIYKLRHTCLSQFLQEWADLIPLQMLTGYEEIGNVAIYLYGAVVHANPGKFLKCAGCVG